jgi:hypothetical protein
MNLAERDGARDELDEDAVAGDLDHAALVLGDFAVDQLPVVCLQDVQILAPLCHDAC